MEIEHEVGRGQVAREKIRAKARNVKDEARVRAEEARAQVRNFTNDRKEIVCREINGIASALRSTSEQLRDQDQERAGHYTEMIGDQAERVARFLEDHDADELTHEVETVARQRPLIFLGGCFVAGLALGRFLKASTPDVFEGNVLGQGLEGPDYTGATLERGRYAGEPIGGAFSPPSPPSGTFSSSVPVGAPPPPMRPPMRTSPDVTVTPPHRVPAYSPDTPPVRTTRAVPVGDDDKGSGGDGWGH